MNVLLTCAGRRNYLVDYFKQSLGDSGQVFAADSSAIAPALQEADAAFVVPNVYDPSYIDLLLSICISQHIRMVIPLNDFELPILAENKARFYKEGIIVAVSDANVVKTCFDKCQTLIFAANHGIAMPLTFFSIESVHHALDAGELTFPLVVKPRWGSASFGIEVCHDFDELVHAYELVKKRLPRSLLSRISSADMERSVMIQAMLCGEEYGLDVVNDFDGRYVCTFVKQKLAMRAGETDKSITVDDNSLSSMGEKIGKCLGHVGNLDCDIFADDKGYHLLEMNPRFGGGYPFSHIAGANIPAALLAWADGKEPDPSWLKITPGVTSVKYDRLVIVRSYVSESLSEVMGKG